MLRRYEAGNERQNLRQKDAAETEKDQPDGGGKIRHPLQILQGSQQPDQAEQHRYKACGRTKRRFHLKSVTKKIFFSFHL